jgi:hypothetical protein
MKEVIEKLLELQELHLNVEPLSLEAESRVNGLRAQVPATVLERFDRLIAHGKTGVAAVQHGVCYGCHLRICSGTFAILTHRNVICICDTCGRYLYLPPSGAVTAEKNPQRKQKRARTALVTK